VKISTCATFGYQCETGQYGGHSCIDGLKKKYKVQISELNEEIMLHKSYAVAMVTIMRDAAKILECCTLAETVADENNIAHMVMQLNACADEYSNIIG